jgi:hypothetical protein
MSTRFFTDKHLQVSPGLTGAVLASPFRRAVALAIDMAIVIIPSLAVAVGVAALTLSINDPRALAGLRTMLKRNAADKAAHVEAFKSILPLLARIEAPGLPSAALAAIEEGKLDEAYEATRDYDYVFVIRFGEFEKPVLKPKTIQIDVGELIPPTLRFLALYGVATVYFSLLLSGKRGATIGKFLVGIRVARIDGHRLSVLESLERFVGYLHIPGTLGLSILDLWRDPNRRLPHDRVVHTVVLRKSR